MNHQTILTIVLVVVLLALGALWYSFWSGAPSQDSGEFSGIAVGSYTSVKDIRLDTTLFNDPVFRELKREIIPPPATESVGRSNPFLPF